MTMQWYAPERVPGHCGQVLVVRNTGLGYREYRVVRVGSKNLWQREKVGADVVAWAELPCMPRDDEIKQAGRWYGMVWVEEVS